MSTVEARPAYVVLSGHTRLDPQCTAMWRRAGSDQNWQAAGAFHAAEIAHDVADAIFHAETADIGRLAELYIADHNPPFYLGAITRTESDALAGSVPVARTSSLIVTAIAACGMRLLLRLSSNGFLEIVPFTRPLGESGFIHAGSARSKATVFIQYRRFHDTVCGRPDTATRVIDCARNSPWRELDRLIAQERRDAAAGLFATWFRRDVNPVFPAPYHLDTGTVIDRDRDPSREANLRLMLQAALHLHPALTHPARIKIQLPTSPFGRARVVPESLVSPAPFDHQAKLAIEVLCGLIAYDLPGYAAHIPHYADGDPCYGHCPADPLRPHTIEVRTTGRPSGHDRLAAYECLAALWEEMRASEQLMDRLDVAGRGREAAAAIDDLFALAGRG